MRLLADSGVFSKEPFRFSKTKIGVYSIEEALFHIQKYLFESIDDINSKDFINWVNSLGFKEQSLPLQNNDKLSVKLYCFLKNFNYLDKIEIENIRKKVSDWENKDEFINIKENADNLYRLGNYNGALELYKKALENETENKYIIKNNIGLCFIRLKNYKKAVEFLENALIECQNNTTIWLNLTESYILNNQLEYAKELLNGYNNENEFKVIYFRGLISFKENNFDQSIEYFKKAIMIKKDLVAYLKLSEVYVAKYEFEKAIEVLKSFQNENQDFEIIRKIADIYAIQKDYTLAIRTIEGALLYHSTNVELWNCLSEYYRLSGDLVKAYGAVCKAISLDNKNINSNIELAKIKKQSGKLVDYQKTIQKTLDLLKQNYREKYQIEYQIE